MDAIFIRDLTKYYGKARGVDRINLTVGEGDFFGFIGPNGAGKSTTIRVLLGLIRPTSGQVFIQGLNVWDDKSKILSEIGYLPSESAFYSGLCVKEILQLSAELRGKDCRAKSQELCERLELDPSRKADELSFGNRKKVSIVAALQHMPQVLILDEPTSGLDPLMQREFFQILLERNQEGATIFLSSHILSEIQRYCTKAAIIRDGKIIALDKVENLTRTNVKRVTVQGQANLQSMEGVRDYRETDGSSSFLYGGEMQQLLNALSRGCITDLSISEPDLEEVFMHYYERRD